MDYMKLTDQELEAINEKDPVQLQASYEHYGTAYICEDGQVVGTIEEA